MKTLSHKHNAARVLTVFLIASTGPLASAKGDVLTSRDIDYSRLAGTWYEIARLPNKREEGLVNITTSFKLVGDDKIEVTNSGHKESDRRKTVSHSLTARLPRPHEPASFTVRICGLFRFTYNVVELDTTAYQYAMISGNSREDLWLFSRTPVMDRKVMERLLDAAREDGFNVADLVHCPQNHQPLAARDAEDEAGTPF